ncbi:MAG: hypothetical protein R3E44_12175 [Paracoccaceae bacterium]
MSDPLTNVEIQDVLSSIRRLVSEEKRATRDDSQAAPPRQERAGRGKLVLTDALRVDNGDEAADTGSMAAKVHAVADAPDEQGGPESLEDTIAELEAAVADIGDDFEPDGSEVAGGDAQDKALGDAFDGGFHVDDGLAIARRAAPESEGETPAAGDSPPDRIDDAVEATEAEVEPASAEPFAAQDVEEPSRDDAREATETRPPETGDALEAAVAALATGGTERRNRLHLSSAERIDQPSRAVWDRDEADADASGHDRAVATADADDDIPGLFSASGDALVDVEVLRDLVAEVLRQELQGPLGERITRNVRKLVRREINRALESSGVGAISSD